MQSSVAKNLGLSTLVQRLKIESPLQKPPKGFLTASAAVVSHEVASTNEPDEEEFKLPSVFEETESFGPEVAEVIAQRVNDACSKKTMDSKLKDLYENYKTPANCKYLCVPKVNLELWHDLSKESKSKDLGLQELQKGIVKASQPIIQLFDSALKARKDKSSMDPNDLLSLLADAVTFLGHASFLTSFKRREFLKPDIARPYQSVCNKSNAITTCLGMNCPNILRRSERSIRFLGRCLAVRL